MYLTLCIPLMWNTSSRVVPAVTLGNLGCLISKACLLCPHQFPTRLCLLTHYTKNVWNNFGVIFVYSLQGLNLGRGLGVRCCQSCGLKVICSPCTAAARLRLYSGTLQSVEAVDTFLGFDSLNCQFGKIRTILYLFPYFVPRQGPC